MSMTPQSFAIGLAFLISLITAPVNHAQIQDRPYDDLSEDATLRRIVDLQNARNASSLIGSLADQTPEVRARAAFALGSVQDSSAILPLTQLLEDQDVRVRADAAFAIGQTGSPADSVLASFLTMENDETVLHELILALGRVGSPDDLVALTNAELPVDLEASRILGITRFGLRSIFSPEAIANQLRYLDDEQATLRERAAYYFWRLRASEDWRERAADVRRAMSHLEPNDPAAGYLAHALATLADTTDLAPIRRLMHATDPRIRVRAVRALAEFHDVGTARSDVLSAVLDTNHHVSITAATVLAGWERLSDQELVAIESLISADDLPRSIISGHLLTAMAKSGRDKEAFSVFEGYQDLPSALRTHLIPALAYVPDSRARHSLFEYLGSDDPGEAISAANALIVRWRRHGTDRQREYYDAFIAALQTGDSGLIYSISSVLTEPGFVELGSDRAMAAVLARLGPPDDTEAMLALISAFGRINSRTSRSELDRMARHPHDVLRRAARSHIEDAARVSERSVVRPIDWGTISTIGYRPRLTVETEIGPFVIELLTDQAPQTVSTIVALAREGRFDGVPFHRVVPDFVVQGGDVSRGDGFGGPGFEIRSEFTRQRFDRGVVGMASAGKDTEGSQFFVTHSMQPHLDGSYTAFGRVVDGMGIVDDIEPQTLILRITLQD